MDDNIIFELLIKHLDKKSLLEAAPELSKKDVETFLQKISLALGINQEQIQLSFDSGKKSVSDAKELILYTDGASRGNPGPAAIGCVINNLENQNLQEYGEYIGSATNNIAEYRALLKGIDIALQFSPERISIFCDSELLVKQMTGIYKTKDANMRKFKEQAVEKLSGIKSYKITHIPRNKNKRADELANKALDKAVKKL
jgi:ribonuclease HI